MIETILEKANTDNFKRVFSKKEKNFLMLAAANPRLNKREFLKTLGIMGAGYFALKANKAFASNPNVFIYTPQQLYEPTENLELRLTTTPGTNCDIYFTASDNRNTYSMIENGEWVEGERPIARNFNWDFSLEDFPILSFRCNTAIPNGDYSFNLYLTQPNTQIKIAESEANFNFKNLIRNNKSVVASTLTDILSPNTSVFILPGNRSLITDNNGNIDLRDYRNSRIIASTSHPDFYPRECYVEVDNYGLAVIDHIPKKVYTEGSRRVEFIDFYNEVYRAVSLGGMLQLWDPNHIKGAYIDTSPALGSGVTPRQDQINLAKRIFEEEVLRATGGKINLKGRVKSGRNPPLQYYNGYPRPQDGWVLFSWDDNPNMLGGHAEFGPDGGVLYSGEEIKSSWAFVRTIVGIDTYLHAIIAAINGGRMDNDSVPVSSVANIPPLSWPSYLSEIDLDSGKIANRRKSGNRNPDINI